MRDLSASWRFLTGIGVVTTLTATAALVLRPLPLPGWLPNVIGSTSGVGRSGGGPLLPDFSVVTGDGRLSVALPPGTDAELYRVDAASEANAGAPGSCLVTDVGSPSGPGCSMDGLRNGIPYLVSLRRVDAPTGDPVRMKHATPIPAVLRSPDIVGWYDAADYSSVRPDQRGPARVGSRVMVLRDKSSRHADATQSAQGAMPVMGQLGPNPALQMSEDSYLAADERGLPMGGHPATVVLVASQDDPAPLSSCFRTVLAWGAARSNQARIIEKGCHSDLAFAETYGSYLVQEPTVSWPTGKTTVVSAAFDRTGTSIWLSHQLSYAWKARPDMVTNTTAGGGLTLGTVTWDAHSGWAGRIGEIIFFDRLLTAGERRAVELYLGAKWQVLLVPDPSPSSA